MHAHSTTRAALRLRPRVGGRRVGGHRAAHSRRPQPSQTPCVTPRSFLSGGDDAVMRSVRVLTALHIGRFDAMRAVMRNGDAKLPALLLRGFTMGRSWCLVHPYVRGQCYADQCIDMRHAALTIPRYFRSALVDCTATRQYKCSSIQHTLHTFDKGAEWGFPPCSSSHAHRRMFLSFFLSIACRCMRRDAPCRDQIAGGGAHVGNTCPQFTSYRHS